ncbi:MAG: D-glycero-beta-D-manno-heptose 1,7-bisphosphate 7-phosphatase [Desulfobacterales bacterium]|nr:MAG: D-glycero-beta-D-manno-heptose 1,7-bisphosphate 7-phosphatase [Desulfobacterales bacterium]
MGLLKKVVFLDRDGTINRDSPDYIKSRSEFGFIPGAIAAIGELTAGGFTCIVITNQSALARGFISTAELDAMHAMMCDEIAAGGGSIKDIFFCPHLPDAGCNCRKPAPGLLFRAQRKYNIDLTDAIMVGDSTKDIECGHIAGCGRTVLVKSGKDADVEKQLHQKNLTADYVAADLLEAVRWIIDYHERLQLGGT